MQTFEFEYNGYMATVIVPEKPNGKWIWKTEFLYAFDQAERALNERGYTRVYYGISDKYGSFQAVRLMRNFHKHLLQKFPFLQEKCALFGFSRGGLYAFNYALFYPEFVSKMYLDAPVLNVKSWPPAGSVEQAQLFAEYHESEDTFRTFHNSPIDNLAEFAAHRIPLLLVAGCKDLVVPLAENGQILLDFYREHSYEVTSILKAECDHHPHSLDDVTPIIEFIEV